MVRISSHANTNCDWRNAVQDEICGPIAHVLAELLPQNDQLKQSIDCLMTTAKEVVVVTDLHSIPFLHSFLGVMTEDGVSALVVCDHLPA